MTNPRLRGAIAKMESAAVSTHAIADDPHRRAITAAAVGLAATNSLRRVVLAALSFGLFSSPLLSATTDTAVSGSLSAVENGCLLVSAFYYGVDCSYNGQMHGTATRPLPWVGPTLGPVYFAPDDPHGVPSYTPGDHEQAFTPVLNGSLTVDDRGTPGGEDDVISGLLTVGAALRSHVTRIDDKSPLLRVVESWTRIVHTLAPTPVSVATRNSTGGYDYILASKGLPPRLCRKAEAQDCFPSATAPLLTDGKWSAGTWAGPSALPLGRGPAFGANTGAQTTAVMENYRCADTAQGMLCGRGIDLWGGPEDPGWDTVLVTISTEASGRVVRAEGYWMDEFRVEAGPPQLRGPAGEDNSWTGGYLILTGGSPPAGTTPPPP